MKRLGIIFAVLAVFSSLSWSLTLTNANFDAQTLADGAWSGGGDVSGWDLNFGWSHAQNLTAGTTGGSMSVPAQSGNNTCGLNGQENSNGGAYVSQIVKENDGTTPILVAANKTYKVTVWVGRRTGDQGSYAGILKVYLMETSTASAPTNIAEATYDLIAQSQDTWTQQTFYLSTGATPVGVGSQLRLMLRNVGNRTATHWHQQVVLDDVTVTDPYIATSPTPAKGAILVPVSTQLSWTAPDAFTPSGYNVRIGTDPNMSTIVAANTPDTTVDPSPVGDLAYNTLYYWRVDAIDPNGGGNPITHNGDVWTFTTVPTTPVIDTQPASQLVESGATAVFTIAASSPTTITYTWYNTTDNANNTSADDTVVGGNSATLSLTATADGYYYCKATNGGGSTYSNVANLAIKRQTAHWTLDALGGTGNQYVDSSPEALHPADANGIPAFVTGMVGNGVTITPAVGWASVGTWDPSQYSGQITISLWAKWVGSNGNWQGLIGKRNAWGADTMKWQIEAAQGTGVLDFKNAGSAVSSPALPAGEWEYVAVTFNGTTATIYRNGVSAASGTFSLGNGSAANLMVGASEKSDTGVVDYTFNGDLDDIQIYNYALSNTDIADLFRAVTGEGVCLNSYASQYDFDGSCKVDLADFANFAAAWLDCGIYPESMCN